MTSWSPQALRDWRPSNRMASGLDNDSSPAVSHGEDHCDVSPSETRPR